MILMNMGGLGGSLGRLGRQGEKRAKMVRGLYLFYPIGGGFGEVFKGVFERFFGKVFV